MSYFIFRRVNPRNISPDVGRRLLERRRRVQVEIFKRVEIKDAGDDREQVLPKCLIERERFEARECISRNGERLVGYYCTGVER